MKIISRAATVTISATAALAFLAPTANADSSGVLRVCVHGLDVGDEADVDIRGRAGWSGEIRGCKSFRAPSGAYSVDIDPPHGYQFEQGDDDRAVLVRSGDRTTVRFWLGDDEDDGDEVEYEGDYDGRYDDDHGDHDDDHHDDDDDHHDDDVTFVRADDDGDCPDGYEHSRVDDDICVRD